MLLLLHMFTLPSLPNRPLHHHATILHDKPNKHAAAAAAAPAAAV
jgi:hypothetical protein